MISRKQGTLQSGKTTGGGRAHVAALSRSDVLLAEEGEVWEDAGEVVVLLASRATARPRHGDATNQRDLRAVVKRPGDVLAGMRVKERAGIQVERACAPP